MIAIMQVVILAGGKGTRLGSLTQDLPKPMMDIDGTPFLELLIRYLAIQGFKRFLVVVGYLPDYIPSVLGDGATLGVAIEYAGDVKNLSVGTGGALRRAAGKLDDQFMLLFGDTLLPVDYRTFASEFAARGAHGMLAVYGNEEDTDVLNNIELDGERRVLRYIKNGSLDYVDAGVSAFDKSVLDLIPDGEVSLEEQVYPQLIEAGELYALPTDQRFFDIGTPGRLEAFKNYYHDYLAHAA